MYEVYRTLPKEAKEIREKVFLEEQGFEEEFDVIDEHAYHILFFDGGEPIGTTRLYQVEGEDPFIWHVGRVALIQEKRGKQLGKLLMKVSEEVIQQQGGSIVIVHAQEDKRGFYEKVGYRSFGERDLEEGVWHIKMVKRL